MPINTTNYYLIKPADDEDADISVINGNMDVIDSKIKSLEDGKESSLKNVIEKTTLTDSDTMPLSDSATSKETKKITYSNIKVGLKTYFDTFYNKITIANNLMTTTAGNALDATQGKALADSISAVNATLINQSKAQNISVSDTTQVLYGVTNVDAALQKLDKTYNIIEISSSQNWIAPTNTCDIFLMGAGANGAGSSSFTGGIGGASGSHLFIPNCRLTKGKTYSLVVGASNGGDTFFDKIGFAKGAPPSSKNANALQSGWRGGEGGGSPYDYQDVSPRGGAGGSYGGNGDGPSAGTGNGFASYCPINGKYYGGGGGAGAPYNTGTGGAGGNEGAGIGGRNYTVIGGTRGENGTNGGTTGAGGGGGGGGGCGAVSGNIGGNGGNGGIGAGGGGAGGAHIGYGAIAGTGGVGGKGIIVIGYYS